MAREQAWQVRCEKCGVLETSTEYKQARRVFNEHSQPGHRVWLRRVDRYEQLKLGGKSGGACARLLIFDPTLRQYVTVLEALSFKAYDIVSLSAPPRYELIGELKVSQAMLRTYQQAEELGLYIALGNGLAQAFQGYILSANPTADELWEIVVVKAALKEGKTGG